MIIELLDGILSGMTASFGSVYLAMGIIAIAVFIMVAIATDAPLIYVAAFLSSIAGTGIIYQTVQVNNTFIFGMIAVLGLGLFFAIYKVFIAR